MLRCRKTPLALAIVLALSSPAAASSAAEAPTQITDAVDTGRQVATITSFDLARPVPICATPQAAEGVPNQFRLDVTSGDATQSLTGSSRDGSSCTTELPIGSVTLSLTATGGRPGSTLTMLLDIEQAQPRWTSAGKLQVARDDHTATTLKDGTVLITGGWAPPQSGPSSSAEIFDPQTGESRSVEPMHLGRVDHRATLLEDGRVLVTGGDLYVLAPTPVAEIFDPATESWSVVGLMTEPRYGHTSILLDSGDVLLAGGSGGLQAATTAEVFDPDTGLSTPVENLPVFFGWDHGSTVLADGRVFLAGGGEDGRGAAIYDPASSSWALTPPMSTKRSWPEASLLEDGRVLVTGGNEMADYKSSTEVYDPATGQWTPAASMVRGRIGHTATTLPDGRVVVVGGRNTTELPLSDDSTEIYDPSADEWTLLPEPVSPRTYHQASLLTDGTLLITGGVNLRDEREAVVERLKI